jgi:hypothetical protein
VRRVRRSARRAPADPPPPLLARPPRPQDFVQNSIHTGWLDSRIAANVKAERPPWHLCVIGSAVVRAYESITSKAAEYLGFLSKGQLPPRDVGLIHFSDDLVLEGVKYQVSVVRRGPTNFSVVCAGVTTDVVARKLGDGGYLLQARPRAGWGGEMLCAADGVGRLAPGAPLLRRLDRR